MRNLSYENEYDLHSNGNSFSYERFRTWTRFETEAKENSEMAYSTGEGGGIFYRFPEGCFANFCQI